MDIQINDIEEEIDNEFNQNPLTGLSYSQAMWTILSVVEDEYLKNTCIKPLSVEQLRIYVDRRINSLSYPIKAIHKASEAGKQIEFKLFDEHYGWALDWLSKADSYYEFNGMFPLLHREKISIEIRDNHIIANGWQKDSFDYEAYNRLIRKDGARKDIHLDPNEIVDDVLARIKTTETTFEINLNPKLVKTLIQHYSKAAFSRYNLPEEWKTSSFSYGEFRSVFVALQAILYGRFVARSVVASQGMLGLGYPSSVYTPQKDELANRLVRYTRIEISKVSAILDCLTFGSKGIREPDIALQPIIDLKNGSYALSPFVLGNIDVERNFCTLLNKITEEKKIYSKLVDSKEALMKADIINDISFIGFRFESGQLENTDLDLAIIDDINKVCICLELKWFIEPAEIREVIERSEELEKGIKQAKNIFDIHTQNDSQLLNLLKIDGTYQFLAVVGSKNWIGNVEIQNEDISIIKVGHLIETIKQTKCLSATLEWLKNRDYLPRRSVDYDIETTKIEMGKWSSEWYGIKVMRA